MRRGPHWLLNDLDAKAYGMALSNALRHLPITAAQKTLDFAALGIAVMVYEGPRIGIDMQTRQRGAQPRPAGPAQVFQFTPSPRPAPSETPQPPRQPDPQQMPPPFGDMTYEPDLGAAN